MNPDERPESLNATDEALSRLAAGAPAALEQLVELVYAELRALAVQRLRQGMKTPSLHPTELVHAAFERLSANPGLRFDNRAHFFGAVSRAMRNIIIDRLRHRSAQKRGGGRPDDGLESDAQAALNEPKEHWLDVDEALQKLNHLDPRAARVAEMKLFGNFADAEIAAALAISERTVRREWAFGRAWLARRLGVPGARPPAE